MKNILIIDDSALMRRVLSDIIKSDERFKVIDYANNGLSGLKILQTKVKEIDAVLLDINMPIMNGLELLAELKKQNIKVKVIIVSTIAVKEAKEVILALELGAFDFVTKPESYDGVKSNKFSERILTCLAVATNLRGITKHRTEEETVEQTVEQTVKQEVAEAVIIDKSKSPRRKLNKDSKLVAIACSTGGPKALHSVIPNLPENLDAPILIVQHMPQGFTKSLSDRLNELSKIKVKEAEHEEILKKGTVYIAKGGYHLRLHRLEDEQYQIRLAKEAARHGLLPCADVMYESLTDTDFDQITCVVLTGMGGDGTEGIKELNKSKNIYVIAQNEETSIVYGMPKVITESGLVDEIVALQEVSDAIIKNVGVH